MPKKARKAIGYQRPKKQKVEHGAPVEEDPDDAQEDEEAENPEPPPPEPDVSDESEAQPRVLMISRLQELTAERDAAEHELIKVIRRWLKTVDTYFNKSEGGFLWDELSVVQRNLARLEQMDAERDKAEDYHDFKKKEVASYKTWLLLRRAARKRPADASYARQRDWARKRLTALRVSWCMDEHRCPTRRPKREASVEDQVGLLMLQVGLAAAIKWVPVRDLREELGDPEPQAAEAAAQAAPAQRRIEALERDRTQLRASVQRRLDAEKIDPSLRFSRNCMLDWGGGCLATECTATPVFHILREMGECVCPFPPQRVGTGTCVMCCAKPTNAVGFAAGSSNA